MSHYTALLMKYNILEKSKIVQNCVSGSCACQLGSVYNKQIRSWHIIHKLWTFFIIMMQWGVSWVYDKDKQAAYFLNTNKVKAKDCHHGFGLWRYHGSCQTIVRGKEHDNHGEGEWERSFSNWGNRWIRWLILKN